MADFVISLQDSVDTSKVVELQIGNYIQGAPGVKGDKGDMGDVTPAATAAKDAAVAAQGAAETAAANASAAATVAANAAMAPIANATAIDADPLSGAEYATVSRGAGVLKTTLTAIAQWVLQTYQGFAQSGTGAVAQTVQDALRERVSVRQFISTSVDGVTSNQAGIAAAVAYAYSVGAVLDWPRGTYVSDANIPNFHTVVHSGAGLVKRGEDVFAVSGSGKSNHLYVSASGSADNDGLSASQPMLTIQTAIDAWSNYARRTGNSFQINLAAGIFTEGAFASGIKNPTELVVAGAGKASTIIDGAAAVNVMGLNFNNCNEVRVKNLTVRNWPGVGSGIIFQNGTRGVIDTCDGTNNAEANFNCSEDSEMVVIGVCTTTGGKFGMRFYRNSGGSVGDGVNAITINAATQAGLVSRDGSKVVADHNLTVTNCNSTGTTAGVLSQKDGYVELRTCTITGNSVGVYVENNSILDTQTGTRNVSGNTQNYRIRDNSVDRSFFSTSGDIAQTWVPRSAPSGLAPSSAYDLVLDYNGATGFQALTNGGLFNLDVNKTERLSFDPSSNHRLTLVLNSANAYRWTNTSYIPMTDNTIALGANGFRWSEVRATNLRPGDGTRPWTTGAGSPEGALVAPVGSLYTRTDGGAGTTLYVKESGTGNTGWVAK